MNHENDGKAAAIRVSGRSFCGRSGVQVMQAATRIMVTVGRLDGGMTAEVQPPGGSSSGPNGQGERNHAGNRFSMACDVTMVIHVAIHKDANTASHSIDPDARLEPLATTAASNQTLATP